MAVLTKKNQALNMRIAKLESAHRFDAAVINTIIYVVAAIILFVAACWLTMSQPLGGNLRAPATRHASGQTDIGNYAPINTFPSTGSTPLVDANFRPSVR